MGDNLVKIMEYTNTDKEQVLAQYRRFLTWDPKGRISRKSFQSMLSDCLPDMRSDRLAQLSNHIWRVYDINEDGQIDFFEFMTVLHVMSSGSSEDNLRQLFRVFDINSDGSISKDELERIVNDFEIAANNEDRGLVNTVFKEMDENNDGVISQEEFVEANLALKKFSTMLTLKVIEIFLVS